MPSPKDHCPLCNKLKEKRSIHCQKCKHYSKKLTSKVVTPQGYIYIYDPRTAFSKRMFEHRYVMELSLGRKLLTFESVHHLNGNRADNRLENLELWVISQPYGQRPSDLVKWAKEIMELYGNG